MQVVPIFHLMVEWQLLPISKTRKFGNSKFLWLPQASLISLKLSTGTAQLLTFAKAEIVVGVTDTRCLTASVNFMCCVNELCQVMWWFPGAYPALSRSCDKGVRCKISIRTIFFYLFFFLIFKWKKHFCNSLQPAESLSKTMISRGVEG